jgi:hypothetical protein
MKRQRRIIGEEMGGKKHYIKRNREKFIYLTMTIQVCLRQKTLQLLYENQRVDVVLGQ